MSNSFAGAKSVDDRRRRRLAQEGLEGQSSRASRRKSSRSSSASQSTDPSQLENSLLRHATVPANTWLWREPWKYAALLVALIVCDAALVLHANRVGVSASESNSTAIINAERTAIRHLPIFYAALCTAAGWLIFYRRSRSRLDFCGRYRLWTWLAIFWTTTTACSLTGWHQRFGDWLAGRTSLTEWHGPLWCWLIPATAALLSSTYLLKAEFASCRTAWRIHCVSLVAAMGAAVALLLAGTSLEANWLAPSATLATILWPTLELGSLLMFARHVVYVSNEPATIVRRKRTRRPALSRLFKRLIAWLLAPREELPAYGDAPPARTTRRKRSPRKKPARRTRKTIAKSRVDATQPSAPLTAKEPTPAASQVVKSPPPTTTRTESPAAAAPQPVKPPVAQQPAAPPKQTSQQTESQARPQQISKPAESRPTSELRVDSAQPKRGPHFAQSSQREEREAVAAVARDRQHMEDDFGDVEDWDEEDSGERQRQHRKHKKKRRR